MSRFASSLTFLYAFTIAVLLLYGWLYYKVFVRSGYQRRRFPFIFFLISAACFSFLYFNFHAPLSLKTFSNVDHYFISHDGFEVSKQIELGRSDTSINENNFFNSFILSKQQGQVAVSSKYSEEPFYCSSPDGSYKILSPVSPAVNHAVSFNIDSANVILSSPSDTSFIITISGSTSIHLAKNIRKASSAWNIFKDDTSFVNLSYYTNSKFINALKNIYVLRDNVTKTGGAATNYFLSGRVYRYVNAIKKDDQPVAPSSLAFTAVIPDHSTIAWGIGFLDNNRNQFRVRSQSADSFSVINRYPVSYPLAEGTKNDWTAHSINKFLVSDTKDMVNMSSVFNEGFLFSAFNADNTVDFSPVLLSFEKRAGNEPVQLTIRRMDHPGIAVTPTNDQFVLPAKSTGFGWQFSIRNTFDWDFSSRTITPANWQLLIFGSLGIFFVLIFLTAWIKRGDQLSWVWQLLSSVTIVLLTTRFFLYWRYKSFPPYDGLDAPSLQQLQSFWNFGIIIAITLSSSYTL